MAEGRNIVATAALLPLHAEHPCIFEASILMTNRQNSTYSCHLKKEAANSLFAALAGTTQTAKVLIARIITLKRFNWQVGL